MYLITTLIKVLQKFGSRLDSTCALTFPFDYNYHFTQLFRGNLLIKLLMIYYLL